MFIASHLLNNPRAPAERNVLWCVHFTFRSLRSGITRQVKAINILLLRSRDPNNKTGLFGQSQFKL